MFANGWWRWPLLPFAAFIGAFLGSMLFYAFQWFSMRFTGYYTEEGWYFLYVMPVLNAGIFGYIFASISYWFAPSHKFIAGVVLGTILGVVGLTIVVVGWIVPAVTTAEAISGTLAVAAWIAGVCFGLASAKDGDRG
ncbi:hypothetical protein H5368_02130 [Luteimonas sp. MC1782]|uniref:hypothetical protein n=1 Tax=Luteimonas sp. MC1782 TaxID=2760305 RepID=UPI00160016EE|nr:hypothetical protein [Luteimonas sp. MC1782]MBB1471822.1 hypothetical protein [Luteimonas sp. MC1782]